jgi:hypothetical protein
MCDQILVIDNHIRTHESELHYLKKLLTICQENQSKGYKCELISEQITKKEDGIKMYTDLRIKNVELCTLYHRLENEQRKNK